MPKCFLSLFAAVCVQAWANPEPISFLPKIDGKEHIISDWDLTCDNRGTCRAAGYYSDDLPVFEENAEFFPVSMMIKREAGKAEVLAELVLQGEDEQAVLTEDIELFLNEKSLGKIEKRQEKDLWQAETFVLSKEQLAAIVAQSAEKMLIELRGKKLRWQLSDVGLREVLQKMDEVQGFAGTSGALLNKGDAELPKQTYDYPTVKDKPFLDKVATVIKRDSEEGKRLLALLRDVKDSEGNSAAENCDIFDDEAVKEMAADFERWRLSESKSLLTGACLRGAYNFASAAWIMDDKLSQVYEYFSNDVSYVGENRVNSNFKGRGLGDCFMLQEYVWDGEQLVLSLDATTGQCKGFGGGAWLLPSVVVQPENSKSYQVD